MRRPPTSPFSSAPPPSRPVAWHRRPPSRRGSRPASRNELPARSACRPGVEETTRKFLLRSAKPRPRPATRVRPRSGDRPVGRACPSSSTMPSANASAEKSRSQHSMIFSNTGDASAIEWLMTSSTSAVAVCCSSASLVSLNRRAFWIAITAWSANVLSSASSLSVNGLGGWRIAQIEPTPRSSHSIGAHATVALPLSSMTPRTAGGGSTIALVSGMCNVCRSRMTRPVIVCPIGLGNVRAMASMRRAAPRADVHLVVVARPGRCRAARWRTGAGSCRGSCRTPARCRPPSC